MFSFRKRSTIPSRDEALPGRPNAIPTAERHFVSGVPLKGPYPCAAGNRGVRPRPFYTTLVNSNHFD